MRAFLLVTLLSLASCAQQPSRPTVVLATDRGEIRIELATDAAPVTAEHFLTLAQSGILDALRFYRVVRPDNDRGTPKVAIVQGGLQDDAPLVPMIPHEPTDQTGLRHVDGSVSMARGLPGTATTEFFICIGDQPGLDAGARRNADGLGFAVFGRVTAGMDIVRDLHATPASELTGNNYVAGQVLREPLYVTAVSVR